MWLNHGVCTVAVLLSGDSPCRIESLDQLPQVSRYIRRIYMQALDELRGDKHKQFVQAWICVD
jgi:hypothetical protein